jgi:hypothetical protein
MMETVSESRAVRLADAESRLASIVERCEAIHHERAAILALARPEAV